MFFAQEQTAQQFVDEVLVDVHYRLQVRREGHLHQQRREVGVDDHVDAV